MAADVFNFSEARNLWILTSKNPESRVKKESGWMQPLFLQVSNNYCISRLLDTVLLRYRSGNCCSNFPS